MGSAYFVQCVHEGFGPVADELGDDVAPGEMGLQPAEEFLEDGGEVGFPVHQEREQHFGVPVDEERQVVMALLGWCPELAYHVCVEGVCWPRGREEWAGGFGGAPGVPVAFAFDAGGADRYLCWRLLTEYSCDVSVRCVAETSVP